MKVWVLLETIDLGDRVWGVFLDEPSARDGLDKLAKILQARHGFSEERVRAELYIEEMTAGELATS